MHSLRYVDSDFWPSETLALTATVLLDDGAQVHNSFLVFSLIRSWKLFHEHPCVDTEEYVKDRKFPHQLK